MIDMTTKIVWYQEPATGTTEMVVEKMIEFGSWNWYQYRPLVALRPFRIVLPQKLNLMESIWDDLTKDEMKLESPVWHKEVLKDREQALASSFYCLANFTNQAAFQE